MSRWGHIGPAVHFVDTLSTSCTLRGHTVNQLYTSWTVYLLVSSLFQQVGTFRRSGPALWAALWLRCGCAEC